MVENLADKVFMEFPQGALLMLMCHRFLNTKGSLHVESISDLLLKKYPKGLITQWCNKRKVEINKFYPINTTKDIFEERT
jgi:hypothetical protein